MSPTSPGTERGKRNGCLRKTGESGVHEEWLGWDGTAVDLGVVLKFMNARKFENYDYRRPCLYIVHPTGSGTFKTSKGMARQILEDRRTERWLHRQAVSANAVGVKHRCSPSAKNVPEYDALRFSRATEPATSRAPWFFRATSSSKRSFDLSLSAESITEYTHMSHGPHKRFPRLMVTCTRCRRHD